MQRREIAANQYKVLGLGLEEDDTGSDNELEEEQHVAPEHEHDEGEGQRELDHSQSYYDYETEIGDLEFFHTEDIRALRGMYENQIDKLKKEHRKQLEQWQRLYFKESKSNLLQIYAEESFDALVRACADVFWHSQNRLFGNDLTPDYIITWLLDAYRGSFRAQISGLEQAIEQFEASSTEDQNEFIKYMTLWEQYIQPLNHDDN